MSTDGNTMYARLALLEVVVAGMMLYTGWPFLALGWVVMCIADLLMFEWTSNPEQYGWFGENPYLASLPLGVLAIVVIMLPIVL